MELKQELKEYLLGFPQEYWLVPCSNSSRYNKVFRFIWLVGVVLGTIFLLMIKWDESLIKVIFYFLACKYRSRFGADENTAVWSS